MTREEQARLGVREISIEMAQDIGLVPHPIQKSPRWIWEPMDKYRDYNIARRQEIVDSYCSDKDLQTCVFPEQEILDAIKLKTEADA